MEMNRHAIILLVEDNPADQELTVRALKKGTLNTDLQIVEDGQEALDYLRKSGPFANKDCPFPDLILMDINMPRMDGKQALKEIRNDPDLKSIPIVMLTTSSADRDVFESYKLGVNAYINKPVEISDFINVISRLEDFWFRLTLLPKRNTDKK